MKIGILTFHEADSYGAVLQAYALQQTLGKLGAQSEFVQISTPAKTHPPAAPASPAALFAKKLQAEGKKREALFADFRREHMVISAPYAPTDDIDGAYDRFVAGSDQIWNLQVPGADARYFLPFARAEKRYSYAASFGADALPEKAKAWVAGQLSMFREISVREEKGCGIVSGLTGKAARVCVDPTLLLDPADWEALAQPSGSAPYVLLFMLKYDPALFAAARAEAQRRNAALKVVTAGFMPQAGMEAWNTTGVPQWLGAIRGAECVFTNSFHGTVFALVFGRGLHVQRLTGELSSRNGRIDELLAFLGLTAATEGVAQPDTRQVWDLLKDRRDASLDYLRRIIRDTAAR